MRGSGLKFVGYFMDRCADVGFWIFVFVEEIDIFVFFGKNFAVLAVGSVGFVERATWTF